MKKTIYVSSSEYTQIRWLAASLVSGKSRLAATARQLLGELERAAELQLTPEHSRIMLCGNPQMIEDTRAVLKARDLNLAMTRRPGQVAVENYW